MGKVLAELVRRGLNVGLDPKAAFPGFRLEEMQLRLLWRRRWKLKTSNEAVPAGRIA